MLLGLINDFSRETPHTSACLTICSAAPALCFWDATISRIWREEGESSRDVVYQPTAGIGVLTNLRFLLTQLSSGSGPLNFHSCLVIAEASLSASFLYMIAANPASPSDTVYSLFEECQMLLAWCSPHLESVGPIARQRARDWLSNIHQFRARAGEFLHIFESMC